MMRPRRLPWSSAMALVLLMDEERADRQASKSPAQPRRITSQLSGDEASPRGQAIDTLMAVWMIAAKPQDINGSGVIGDDGRGLLGHRTMPTLIERDD
eukprot:2175962-Pyramimonas_sp.AAC.1